MGDLNFRKLYAVLMSDTPQKIKLESVPILVAIFDIWNSNVLICSPNVFTNSKFSPTWFILFSSKQFDLLKKLVLGNRGKGGFV